ncbi:uncharacterized protein LOC106643478 [Copidosoma floridanum]|uniref:uncharacterized protein LOC106643478 n=1 Tax=Copidosoma floridanum TaxID=29053 RepID=UPI0006C98C1F|nr:uncharacterized protein LOC106643478 [Copidosoma floridanum]
MKCFLCLQGDPRLKKCTNKFFTKIKHAIFIRATLQLKYGDVILPEAFDKDLYYHSQCYRNVNSIGKKYLTEYELQLSDGEIQHPKNFVDYSTCVEREGPVPEVEDNTRAVDVLTEVDAASATDRPCDTDSSADVESAVEQPISIVVNGYDLANPEILIAEPLDKSFRDSTSACFFCNVTTTKKKGRLCTSKDGKVLETIERSATILKDVCILNKLEYYRSQTFNVLYHKPCLSTYIIQSNRLTLSHKNEKNYIRNNLIKEAENTIRSFIQKRVVNEKKLYFLSHLEDKYIQETKALFHCAFLNSPIHTQRSLRSKLLRWFPTRIKFVEFQSKTIVAPTSFCPEVEAHELSTELCESQCSDEATSISYESALNVESTKLDSDNIDHVSSEEWESEESPWRITSFYEKIF